MMTSRSCSSYMLYERFLSDSSEMFFFRGTAYKGFLSILSNTGGSNGSSGFSFAGRGSLVLLLSSSSSLRTGSGLSLMVFFHGTAYAGLSFLSRITGGLNGSLESSSVERGSPIFVVKITVRWFQFRLRFRFRFRFLQYIVVVVHGFIKNLI